MWGLLLIYKFQGKKPLIWPEIYPGINHVPCPPPTTPVATSRSPEALPPPEISTRGDGCFLLGASIFGGLVDFFSM